MVGLRLGALLFTLELFVIPGITKPAKLLT